MVRHSKHVPWKTLRRITRLVAFKQSLRAFASPALGSGYGVCMRPRRVFTAARHAHV
jgi:hypothetical protein